MSDLENLKAAIEALIFISGNGMTPLEISKGLNESADQVRIALDSIADEFSERNGGLIVQEIGGRFQFTTRPQIYPLIQNFLREKKKETLSRSALETLAIITYKQPITLAEIDEIRGVNSRSQIAALLAKKLIKQGGVKEAPGRPSLYGTTKGFLEYFGLNNLEELPPPQDIKELNFEDF